MPLRGTHSNIVRLVVGERGRVTMCTELVLRFGYGAIVPWVTRLARRHAARHCRPRHGGAAHAGRSSRGENFKTVGEFTVAAGETVPFVLTYAPSHLPPPEPIDPDDRRSRRPNSFWRELDGEDAGRPDTAPTP